MKGTKNERIESFLSDKYDFRFNIIKSKPEYKLKSEKQFRSITKFDLNTLKRELDKKEFYTSTDNIRSILESDFSTKTNPVQEYFRCLLRYDPKKKNYIIQLADTVEVHNSEKWTEYLTKWLVAIVANALNDIGCQNHTCLVLTGEQGKFKTTWLDLLCPKILSSYLYTGKIDPQNKDVLTLIAEYLLINIDDQLKALNKKDENELKNFITMPFVKYRRPYDVYIEEYPHLASFMASVNGNDFLTDPTGSRRFLPFEVISIDIKAAKAINIDNVYSEALWLYENGFRYWFNDAEIDELHRMSKAFHVQTIEYEMLIQAFEKPSEKESENCFMTTGEIINYLKRWTTLQYSEKRMGEALKKAGFPRMQKRSKEKSYAVYGYLLRKVDPNPFIETL